MNGIGLWLIKSQAVGTAVATVTLTGAFSSDYNNYKIVWEGGKSSASAPTMQFQFGGITTTNYFTTRVEQTAGTATVLGAQNSSLVAWILGYAGNQQFRFDLDLSNPNTTNLGTVGKTLYTSLDNLLAYGGTSSHWLEIVTPTTTTSFTLTPGSGTFTGGTIRVYGYRN